MEIFDSIWKYVFCLPMETKFLISCNMITSTFSMDGLSSPEINPSEVGQLTYSIMSSGPQV